MFCQRFSSSPSRRIQLFGIVIRYELPCSSFVVHDHTYFAFHFENTLKVLMGDTLLVFFFVFSFFLSKLQLSVFSTYVMSLTTFCFMFQKLRGGLTNIKSFFDVNWLTFVSCTILMFVSLNYWSCCRTVVIRQHPLQCKLLFAQSFTSF